MKPSRTRTVVISLVLAAAGTACPPPTRRAAPGPIQPARTPAAPEPPPPAALPPRPADCTRARTLETRAQRLSDPGERIHVLEQAVELCGTEARLLRELALAHRDAGENREARRLLEQTLTLDPSDSAAREALDSLAP